MNKLYFNTYCKTTVLTVTLMLLFFYSKAQVPNVDFTSQVQSGCSPLIINFQDLSTGNPTSWNWDFGNGNTSTLQNPSATYFNPGTYTVRLTATNSTGSNTLTRTAYITVHENPIVDFSADNVSGCFPVRVQFTDMSTPGTNNTNVSWQWDFGNGTTSSLQNPLVTYTSAGLFTVTLTVINDKGCRRTVVKPNYISVTTGVTADFTNTQPTVCSPPVTIDFTNASTGPGTLTYQWDFGDGGTSTLLNPSHSYITSGSFFVTLITTSSAGCVDTFRAAAPIVIGGIITSFIANATACLGQSVSFTNTSIPPPISSIWNFGDGNGATTINAVHNYAAAGTYPVTLYNTYSNCIDSFTQNITINPLPVADFSSPDTIRCEPPLTTNFTDLSTGGATDWQWDFGDGGTSAAQNPSHTYTAPGFYTVTLITTNNFGCTDTMVKTNYVRIRRAIISIAPLPIRDCVPLTISPVATVNSLDAVTSWFWDFGDGTTSTLQFPTHTYPVQGTFTVKLFITTSTGCTDSLVITDAVRIGTRPTANFTATPTPVCARHPVTFTDLSVPADEWEWDFGDGGTSVLQNPVYNYQDTGWFDVRLIATNNGCPDTIIISNFIYVRPPIARFTSVTNCNNRLQFIFTDNSIAPLTWNWDFGDGTTSTLQNPVHAFPSLGSYTVRLIVTNGGCADTMIQVIRAIQEAPNFFAQDTVLCRVAAVFFTAVNLNPSNISSYTWNYGDGTIVTGSIVTSGHTYIYSGTYSVSLIITDLNGCTDSIRKNNYIRINGPLANFSITNPTGCVGLSPGFNDLSTNDGIHPIISWQWDYGDGTVQTYTAPPFQHTYNTIDTFSVKLIVTDNIGCRDSMRLADYIYTSDPVPSFFTFDTLACPGSLVSFVNISTGTGLSYMWDFGDGNGSNLPAPTNNYFATGNYTVGLWITDQYGCRDSLIRNLYIRVDTPRASFNISDSISSCTPLQVQFTNTSSFYTSSLWDFGGGTSTLNNPVHYYGLPGTYNVKLVVTSPGGCVDSTFRPITIYDTSGTALNYFPYQACSPLTASFNIITQGVYNYLWDFGDGNTLTTTTPNATHTYTGFGIFIPKVIMQDPSGCLIPVEGVDTIQVWGARPDFGVDNNLFCDRATVNFSDSTTSSDPVLSYNWSFGDGGTSTQSNPVHNYSAPGLYNIRLIVRTQTGCLDTIQKNALIRVVQSPIVDIVGDTDICVNQTILHSGVFQIPDTSVVTWSWSFPNGNNSSVQNPPTQTYNTVGTFPVTTIATNTSGCRDTVVQDIVIYPLPTATLPPQMTVQNGFPVTIPATYSPNTINWAWYPPAGLSCTNCPTPDAGPKFNTVYNVVFTDDNGCVNTASVEVIVICKNSNLFIPNTFSPNGDGNNDRFYPRGRGLDRVKMIRIFNRWGEVVFEKYNIPVNVASAGWDGTYKGKKPQADVYIYQAEVFCENGEVIRLNGNIALIL